MCLSYFTRVLRYHQGNMGGWLMVSISKHSLLYMCHWPKDPNVFNCLLLFFPPTPLSNSSLFSSFLPYHPLTFHLPPPPPDASPSFLFSAALLSPTSSSILLKVVFRSHNFAVKRGMRPSRSLHFFTRRRPEHGLKISSVRLQMESNSNKERATNLADAVCVEG